MACWGGGGLSHWPQGTWQHGNLGRLGSSLFSTAPGADTHGQLRARRWGLGGSGTGRQEGHSCPQTPPSLPFTRIAGGPGCRALYEFRVVRGADGPPISGGGLLLGWGDCTAPVADLSSRPVRVGEAAGQRTETRAGALLANGAAWPPKPEPEAQSPNFTAGKLTSVPQWPRICCPSPAAWHRHDTRAGLGLWLGTLGPKTSQAPTRWHSL